MMTGSAKAPARTEAPSASSLLTMLMVFAATCFLTANVLAVKVVSILGHLLPGGAVVYPLTFLLDDVIVEVYGFRQARRAIWLGFAANLIFLGAASVVLKLPSAPFWHDQSSYRVILSYGWRILAGASTSYLLGSFANAIVMSRMKLLMGGKALWLRTIASTTIGQGIDSVVFVSVAYAGAASWSDLRELIITVWLFKTGYEALCTPLVYRVVNWLKRREGRDTFDRDSDYSPLPHFMRFAASRNVQTRLVDVSADE